MNFLSNRSKAHRVALEKSREAFDQHKHQSVVITEGAGFMSASSPKRLAWDIYFDSMLAQGYSAWATYRKFDRAIKKWK